MADSIIWSYYNNGNFSVKSAYRVVRRIQGEDMAGSSTSSAYTKIWKVLWNLKIPNKMKVFGWRAYANIFPTRVNLVRRRVLTDDKCPLCLRNLRKGADNLSTPICLRESRTQSMYSGSVLLCKIFGLEAVKNYRK